MKNNLRKVLDRVTTDNQFRVLLQDQVSIEMLRDKMFAIASFSYVMSPKATEIDFWLCLVSKLLNSGDLTATGNDISCVIQIAHCFAEILGDCPEYTQKIERIINGDVLGTESQVENFPRLFFVPETTVIENVVRFKDLHKFEIPDTKEIIKRTMLLVTLQFDFSVDLVKSMNADYFAQEMSEQQAFSFTFVRWIYERMFGVRIARTPALAESPFSLVKLPYNSWTNMPFTEDEPSTTFLKLMEGSYIETELTTEFCKGPCTDMIRAFVPELNLAEIFAIDCERIAHKSYNDTAKYWCSCAQRRIKETHSILEAMMICRMAVRMFKTTNVNLFAHLLDLDNRVNDYKKPDEVPVGKEEIPKDTQSLDNIQAMISAFGAFDMPVVSDVIPLALQFAASEYQVELESVEGMKWTNEIPFKEAVKFFVAKYLYKTITKSNVLTKHSYSKWDENQSPVEFSESLETEFLILGLLNNCIKVPEVLPEPSVKWNVARLFLKDQLDDRFQKIFAQGCDTMAGLTLLTNPVNLVLGKLRSGIDVMSELQGIPDCLKQINPNDRHYNLLSIFLGPRKQEVLSDKTLEVSVENTAKLIHTYKLPADEQFCMDLLRHLYEKFWELSETATEAASTYESPYLYFICTPKPLDLCATMLRVTIRHIRTTFETEIDPVITTDLSEHLLSCNALRSGGQQSSDRFAAWTISKYVMGSPHCMKASDLMLRYFLRNGNFKMIESLLPDKHEYNKYFNVSTLERYIPFMEGSHAANMCEMLIKVSEEKAIRMMWKLILREKHSIARFLFKKLKVNRAKAFQVVEMAPSQITDMKTYSSDVLYIYSHLAKLLPHKRMVTHSEEFDVPTLKWKDDKREEKNTVINDDIFNPWVPLEVEHKCTKTCDASRDVFVCQTCGNQQEICLACAMHCHHGHKVVWRERSRFTCHCNDICPCGQVPDIEQESNQQEHKEIQGGNTTKLIELMLSLSHAESVASGIIPKSDGLDSDLNDDIRTMRMPSSHGTCRDIVVSAPVVNNFVDPKVMGAGYSPTSQYQNRSSQAYLKLTETVDDFLCLANGKSLEIRDLDDYRVLSRTNLSDSVVFMRAHPRGERDTLLAVGGIASIDIFSISAAGQAEKLYHMTMPGGDYKLYSIDWVCGYHIAVLSTDRFDVYSIGTESYDRVESFSSNGDPFSSAFFIENDGTTYAFVAHGQGRIAKIPLLRHTDRLRYVNWPSSYVGIHVSYCKEANLVFLGAPGVGVHLYRGTDVVNDNTRTIAQSRYDNNSGDLLFVCPYPGLPNILIFVAPQNNSYYALEIKKNRMDSSRLLPKKQDFRIYDRNQSVIGIIEGRDSIRMIDAKGNICDLTRDKEESNDDGDEDIDEVDGIEFDEYTVPPSFWTYAEVATKNNSNMTGTDNSQDYTTLYRNSPAYFNNPGQRNTLTFHVKDPSYCIVGVMLSFGNHSRNNKPVYVSCKGRKYRTENHRAYMFPLKPDEIQPGAQLDLHFPPSSTKSQYSMQGAAIFIIKADKLPAFSSMVSSKRSTWDTNPASLIEFNDLNLKMQNPVSNTAAALAFAILPKEDEQISESSFRQIIRAMYTKPAVSLPARSIIVRIVQKHPNLVSLWEDELKHLVTDKLVEPSLMQYVWRDVSMMSTNTAFMWESQSAPTTTSAIITAFSSFDA